MAGLGVGDLAQHMALRRQNMQLKAEFNRISAENASGKVADLSQAVTGDHRAAAAMTRSLTTLAAVKTATAEATLIADAAQTTLSSLQSILSGRFATVHAAGVSGDPAMLATTATEARSAFSNAVSALNIQVSGRPVFSGTSDQSPLPSADDLFAEITAAVGGVSTATGVKAAIDDWFANGGFDTVYRGATTPFAPFELGEGRTTGMTVTARDPAIKDTLRSLALAAFAGESGLSAQPQQAAALMTSAGELMSDATDRVTRLAAGVGVVQARIGEAETRNSAETSTLKIALARLTEVDPYESATALEAVEGQQNLLYAVTARLSALSLLDFLR